MVFSRILVVGLSLLFVLECSAETKDKSGKNGSMPFEFPQNSEEGNLLQETCPNPGQQVACYCQDGTKSGTQLCMESGSLGQCEGCPSPSESPAEEMISNPEVCEELQGSVGCTAKSYKSEKLPPSILFVVDRSGSMLCNTPADGQTTQECEQEPVTKDLSLPTKWDITKQALNDVFANLQDSGSFAGLMFFSNNGECGVHSDLSLGGVPLSITNASQVTVLQNALHAIEPSGGTPLVGGTILAYAYLHQEASGDCKDPPCGAPGNRFVVLITDGADSCPDPNFENSPCSSDTIPCTHYLLDSEVIKAVNANIRTFVIGAPGSEPARGFLSELAFKGSTAKNGGSCQHNDRDGTDGDCHYDMTETHDFAADLSDSLLQISGSALGCEFAVPDVPNVDPTALNVQYILNADDTPTCIPKDESLPCDGGANGWQFAKNADGNEDLSKVVLCGEFCDLIKNNPTAKVDVILGCMSIIVE